MSYHPQVVSSLFSSCFLLVCFFTNVYGEQVARTCYKCLHATNITDCTTNIVLCPSTHFQTCFFQKSLIGGGNVFSAGCREIEKCTPSVSMSNTMSIKPARRSVASSPSSLAQITCDNCCSSHLCNTGQSCFQARISPTVATGLVYDKVHFRCTFDFNMSEAGVTWYKEDQQLDLGQHPRLATRGTELVISMIDRLDSGQYKCGFVYQNTTYISPEASLVIAGGPELKASSWTVPAIGRTVEISCDVTGATTSHQFFWTREDGSSIQNQTAFTVVDTPISTKLVFSFDSIRKSGIYVCKDVGSLDFQPYGKVGVVYNVGPLTCGTKFSVCPSSHIGSVCGGRCPSNCGFNDSGVNTHDTVICDTAGPQVDASGGFVVWTYSYQNGTGFLFPDIRKILQSNGPLC